MLFIVPLAGAFLIEAWASRRDVRAAAVERLAWFAVPLLVNYAVRLMHQRGIRSQNQGMAGPELLRHWITRAPDLRGPDPQAGRVPTLVQGV